MPIRFKLRKPGKKWRYVIPETALRRFEKAGFTFSYRKPHDRCVVFKRKPLWEQFEEDVLILFRDGLKLADVDGGPALKIAGYQVDVVAGIEDILLVVECKSKKEPGEKSLRSALRAFWVKKREITGSLRRLFKRRYSQTKFLMILRGIAPSDRDLRYAKKKNIVVWPESYFDSIRSLFLKIGERAKYYMLRELGEVPPLVPGGRGRYFTLPALATPIGEDHRLYSLFMPTRMLLDIAYVLRVESGQRRAYQRYLDKSRLTRIARFIEGGNSFKNSIVLAIDRRSKFAGRKSRLARKMGFECRTGFLRVPRQYASAWIIDGQHRLYGFARLEERYQECSLPVVALQSSSRTEEAKTFLDINRYQKPVDTNLLWALYGTLYPHETRGIISDFVRLMAFERNSVLYNKIFVPGESKHSRKHYRVFHSNLCETVQDHLLEGKERGFPLLTTKEMKEPGRTEAIRRAFKTLNAYLTWLCRQARTAGERKWIRGFFLTNNGLNVAVRVLALLMRHMNGRFDRKALEGLFGKALREYLHQQREEVDQLRRQTSSEGTRDFVAYGFVWAMAMQVKDFASDYIKEHQQGREEQEPYKLLREVEESLRNLISERLSDVSEHWWKERIPGDVREDAKVRKEQDESPWPWMEGKHYPAHYYMNFSDYSKVICRKDNWREAFRAVFKDQEWVRVNFRELERTRNDVAHNRELTNRQTTLLRLYSEDLARVVSGAPPRIPVASVPKTVPVAAAAAV